MADALMIAYSSAVPGRDAEYDRWYEENHVPDIRAAIPSITAVHRYRQVDLTGGSDRIRYVAVYDLGDVDVATAAGQLAAAAAAGRLRPTDAMDRTVNPPELQWFAAARDSAGA